MKVKDENIKFRCSSEEKQLIKEKAKAAGYSNESEYMRRVLTQGKTINRELFNEIHKAVFHISKIGTNINQIVHRTNLHIYSEIDKQNLSTELKNCNATLEEILDWLNGGKDG